MANEFFENTHDILPQTRARASQVEDNLDAVTVGFDKLQVRTNAALKAPDGENVGALPAANLRRGRVIGFNAVTGAIETQLLIGDNRGGWLTGTSYNLRDLAKDPDTANVYQCLISHTSADLATDIAAGRWTLLVDAQSATDSASAAAASAAAALVTRNETTAIRDTTLGYRNEAQDAMLAAQSVANFKGAWANLSGALNMPAVVYHNGKFWALLNNLANVALSEPGVTGDWAKAGGGGAEPYTYDSRGDLRTVQAQTGDQAIVEGLGLFMFYEGSDEPDDDESCFATATGRWLLEAANWDVVDTWQLPDDEARDAFDEDEPLRFASSFASRVLHGTATCAITSVSATTSASFTGTVTGAAVGDRVIATPPAQLGSTAADTGRLAYHAWVSANNTVTVMLTNASAASATTNPAVRTAWPITVIKNL
jgi:hypothetical protein